MALKRMAAVDLHRLSAQERVEQEDFVTTMRAMADPKKTAAIYFAMAQAKSEHDGRPLSDEELSEAKEISEELQQERLTDAERQAVERLARKRK